ncbi:iron-sulfur cluster assembly accessory protein [Myxococcota bacterium]|nr:iron-sulfur cluster assembly accessory protein [Myxococcota bacterium]
MLTVSESAARRIRAIIDDKGLPPEAGLRVSVEGGGCSGLSYKLAVDDQIDGHDRIFDSNGVRLIVDMKSLLYTAGLEVHYNEDDFHGGFEFRNPQAKSTCGCGTSFAV